MKTAILVLVALASAVPLTWAAGANSTPVPTDTAYQVVERGANHQVWRKESYERLPNGKIVTHPHQYTELASGLNYLNNGQWTPTQEKIEVYPGGAVARQGQHQVIFANNLNSYGAIDMQTPEGQRLRSNLLGLMYYDTATGEAVLIARLQDSEGQVVADNQVLYPNAFEGLSADVRYTYTKSGLEQDVIVNENPASPKAFGMTPETTELEVFTEFIDSPTASLRDLPEDGATLETDQEVRWGGVRLGKGKAFNLGGQDSPAAVVKRYVTIQGRHFLLEKVAVKDIQKSLSQLPDQAANTKRLPMMAASKNLVLPQAPRLQAAAKPMKLAMGAVPDRGYVLDYVSLTSSYTNYTFQGDTTYYISGSLGLYGTNVFEGGAVIKYALSPTYSAPGYSITCYTPGGVVFKTAPYLPVVFTARDDNSIGEAISGSTGNPSNIYGSLTALNGSLTLPAGIQQISGVRFMYQGSALTVYPGVTVNNAQFVNCGVGLSLATSGQANLNNALSVNVNTNLLGIGATFVMAQSTFDKVIYLGGAPYPFSKPTLRMTNCVLANVTNVQGTIYAGFNGFYKSPMVGSAAVTNVAYPFYSVGAGGHYLTNGCSFIDAGTTNLSTDLLAALKLRTVNPPLVYSNVTISTNITFYPQAVRDTNTPDLGYHYDPLDYVFGNVNLYSNLTFTAGTAVGTFVMSSGAGYGIMMHNGDSISFTGTATSPCRYARYSNVQEGGNGVWSLKGWLAGIAGTGSGSVYPKVVANYTLCSCFCFGDAMFRDYYFPLVLQFNDCEFYSGGLAGYGLFINATNCLFKRINLLGNGTDGACGLAFRNDTFYGGVFYIQHWNASTWPVWIENCAFDGVDLSSYVNDYSGGNTNITYCNFNAYLTNGSGALARGRNDVVVSSFNWQSNWLGNYYLPADSLLIDKGSVTADRGGLYEYTTQASQTKEGTTVVDIGYHYVAVDSNGNPIATFTNGVPDYLVDSNGNGLPDWWEFKWFGDYSHTATELDGQGHTLGYDYTNGLDPNIIDFALHLPLGIITSNSVNASIPIYSGKPSYMAVLVNDTNQADAVWQPYSSKVAVNLNAGDGVYNISIGLRGWATEAQASWRSGSVVMYSPALTLTLTNPVNNTVSQPVIQLQGFASKALSSVTYDVSNATGIFTNQTGYVTGQFYDTNHLAFAMSFFQCYDVALTNGANIITIHATDLDGDAINLTNNYTLDYSGDHTPPALTVLWPTNGTYIAGSSFTLQGQVDDATATINAAIVDAGGHTNVVSGLVERNGKVWAKDLLLGSGVNTLTVTATDAAGNSSTINLALYQSSVMVTLNPLTGSQLNQSSVTVSGTVSDATASVSVNGQSATVNSDGTWVANLVPVSATGVAVLDTEVSAGGNSPNASAKSKAVSTVQANVLPSETVGGSQQSVVPQPPKVVMASYQLTYHENWTWDQFHNGEWWASPTETLDNQIHWSFITGGTQHYDLDYHDFEDAPDIEDSTYPAGLNAFSAVWENAATAEIYVDYWSFETQDDNRAKSDVNNQIQTHVMVEPSGLAHRDGDNWYLIRASALELPDPATSNTKKLPLPPEWLQINHQNLSNTGITNDNGSFWGATVVSAPAGAEMDVTPVATQVYQYNDYTFDVQALEIQPPTTDLNRDGQITFDGSDKTSPDKPFRFWINDSKESGDDESGGGADDQIPGQPETDVVIDPSGGGGVVLPHANYARNKVNGRSDLVNYFPVALNLGNLLQCLPITNGFEYHLIQENHAVKFVYTGLTPANAFDYLSNVTTTSGYGTNFDQSVESADTIQVPNIAPGVLLDTNWLAHVQNYNGGNGLILLEGSATTTKPLWLMIWHKDASGTLKLVGGVPMYLSISGVEQMFRHANFCYVNGSIDANAEPRKDAPNEPLPNNGKNLVFVHGYNVNQQEARGVQSEIFKRFYWSHSHASFYGVTWNGAASKDNLSSLGGQFTPNYHTNVVNALLTAPHLKDFLKGLKGEATVVAHSLGNMVVLSAISDCGVTPHCYFMLDAAVPMEAVQGNAASEPTMIHSTWQCYLSRLYASCWWQLFPTNDARSTLTWSNRLGNLGAVDIYNFYSSGEEVLRQYSQDPPTTIIDSYSLELYYRALGIPFGTYGWVWQEKGKGTYNTETFIGSMHGGWQFNDIVYGTKYYNDYGGGYSYIHMLNTDANRIANAVLETVPFFDFNSQSVIHPDNALTGADGNTYALANRDRILSDAIPALTLPVGANAVSTFDDQTGGKRNFDMQQTFKTGWPGSRSSVENQKWHHSDFDYVAYPFTHQLFDNIVNIGSLK
jgi:hypothetical protein